MGWTELALLGLTLPPAILWVAALGAVRWTVRGVPRLREVAPAEPASWPSLTIVVPARDEEAKLASSLAAHLASDYPALTVMVVDDRSTDRTPEIVAAFAREDPRVRSVRLETLPAQWLGKLHAMAEGARRAEGDWLLFADADVRLDPGALRRAIAYAEDGGLDFLSLIPAVDSAGLLGDTVFNVLGTAMALGARLPRVRDPGSSAAAGSGAFLLVRRRTYQAGPGLSWMSLEVADDQALCLLIKAHGGRCEVLHGTDDLRLRWYHGFGELMRLTQKNLFGIVGRFSPARCVAVAATVAWLALFPLAALAGDSPLFWVAPGVGVVALIGATLWSARWLARPPLPALLAPLGLLLLAFLTLRAGLIGWRIGGIEWRGRRYPSALLRARQRWRM